MSSVSEIIAVNRSLLEMESVDVMGVRMVPFDKVLSIFDQISSASSSSDLDSLFGGGFTDASNMDVPFEIDTMSSSSNNDIVKVDTVSSSGKWVGNIGDNVALDLEYVSSDGPKTGNYGDYYIYTFDYMGNKVTWLTNVYKSFNKGQIYKTICEIKEHAEFNGERITRVKGCRFQ